MLRVSVLAVIVLGLFHSSNAVALEEQCTQNSECNADTADSYCATTCQCLPLFTPDGTTACNPKACTADSECIALSANSYCPAGDATRTCTCKTTFEVATDTSDGVCAAASCTTTAECSSFSNTECSDANACVCTATFTADASSGDCVANIPGSTCSADGGECANIANGYCDVSNTVCACKPRFPVTEGVCTKKPCSVAVDCSLIANTECTGGYCMCKVTFPEHATTGVCTANAIGSTCTDGGCAELTNAYCGTADPRVCMCKERYTGTNCPLDVCTDDASCSAYANTECTGEGTKSCTCTSGFEEDSTTGSCVAKGLESACTADAECAGVANSKCSTDSTCTCKDNYTKSNMKCTSNGGPQVLVSTFLLLLCAVVTMFS